MQSVITLNVWRGMNVRAAVSVRRHTLWSAAIYWKYSLQLNGDATNVQVTNVRGKRSRNVTYASVISTVTGCVPSDTGRAHSPFLTHKFQLRAMTSFVTKTSSFFVYFTKKPQRLLAEDMKINYKNDKIKYQLLCLQIVAYFYLLQSSGHSTQFLKLI